MKSKKYVVAALALVGSALLPLKAHAAFQSFGRSTNTAIAELTGGGTVLMAITLRNISDNSTTTQLYWTGVTLPSTFVRSGAYIDLASTMTASGGGIQIYTDNTSSVDANPKYTYASSTFSNPAGLVDTTTTTKTLPLAWSIKDTTATATAPTAADPTSGTDPNASQWLFFKDRATQSDASQNTTPFADGETFIAVKRAGDGIHFGQSDTAFGAAPSPDDIYVEANFNGAVTPRTYKTSTLRLERYTQ